MVSTYSSNKGPQLNLLWEPTPIHRSPTGNHSSSTARNKPTKDTHTCPIVTFPCATVHGSGEERRVDEGPRAIATVLGKRAGSQCPGERRERADPIASRGQTGGGARVWRRRGGGRGGSGWWRGGRSSRGRVALAMMMMGEKGGKEKGQEKAKVTAEAKAACVRKGTGGEGGPSVGLSAKAGGREGEGRGGCGRGRAGVAGTRTGTGGRGWKGEASGPREGR